MAASKVYAMHKLSLPYRLHDIFDNFTSFLVSVSMRVEHVTSVL